MPEGYIIEIEGANGAGKTTLAASLAEALGKLYPTSMVALCREPGGTVWAERIREVLFADETRQMDETTRCLLYSAARSELYREVIEPLLKAGGIIVKDRGELSAFAYQSSLGLGTVSTMQVGNVIRLSNRGRSFTRMIYLRADSRLLWNRLKDRGDGSHAGYVTDEKSVHDTVTAYDRAYGYMMDQDRYAPKITVLEAHSLPDALLKETLQAVRTGLSFHGHRGDLNAWGTIVGDYAPGSTFGG